MKTLESIIEGLTDEQLKEAFNEIVEWRKAGVLTDGIVRKAHTEFVESNNVSFPIFGLETPFLFEIAKRYLSKIK